MTPEQLRELDRQTKEKMEKICLDAGLPLRALYFINAAGKFMKDMRLTVSKAPEVRVLLKLIECLLDREEELAKAFPPREPVQHISSTNLQESHYRDAERTLRIRFKNGGEYQYQGVPADVYESLTQADSAGKFFNEAIKNKYPFIKLR